LPLGKVLGGSGSINAMVWTRGHRADYETGPEAMHLSATDRPRLKADLLEAYKECRSTLMPFGAPSTLAAS
jgi:choline dehydrogenase-like flavoprotein